jgi:hypothetical protein
VWSGAVVLPETLQYQLACKLDGSYTVSDASSQEQQQRLSLRLEFRRALGSIAAETFAKSPSQPSKFQEAVVRSLRSAFPGVVRLPAVASFAPHPHYCMRAR